MTSAGTPERTDLSDEQRTRLEALTEAKTVLGSGYRDPVDLDALERVAIFILDGAEGPTPKMIPDPQWRIEPGIDTVTLNVTDGSTAEFTLSRVIPPF